MGRKPLTGPSASPVPHASATDVHPRGRPVAAKVQGSVRDQQRLGFEPNGQRGMPMGGCHPPTRDPGNNGSTDQGNLVAESPYMPPGNRHCRAGRHWQGLARQVCRSETLEASCLVVPFGPRQLPSEDDPIAYLDDSPKLMVNHVAITHLRDPISPLFILPVSFGADPEMFHRWH